MPDRKQLRVFSCGVYKYLFTTTYKQTIRKMYNKHILPEQSSFIKYEKHFFCILEMNLHCLLDLVLRNCCKDCACGWLCRPQSEKVG